MIIERCELNDSGEYKALLSNPYGEVQSKCRVNIIPNPISQDEITRNSPSFVELVKDISVNFGQDVCFKCKITGIPAPDVKWFKDGKLIEENSRFKVSQRYLPYILLCNNQNTLKVKRQRFFFFTRFLLL